MRIATIAILGGSILLAGCDEPSADIASQSTSMVTETVQFEGSDVQVSWDPQAKTSATLVHDSRLSIWSNAAADLISETTGCEANPGVLSYPGAADGFEAVSMSIQCQ